MKEFLLLIKGEDQNASPEAMQQRMQDFMEWKKKMMESGHYLAGQPLEAGGVHLPNTTEVITDGPFLEPKEIIGGYIIVKADDIQHATEIGQNCPLLTHCELYVRPLMALPGD